MRTHTHTETCNTHTHTDAHRHTHTHAHAQAHKYVIKKTRKEKRTEEEHKAYLRSKGRFVAPSSWSEDVCVEERRG
jgi:hypothetical protein